MNIRFGSLCSGIEAASVAWEPLGWQVSAIKAVPVMQWIRERIKGLF